MEQNVVTRAEWAEARRRLLRDEKALTRVRDAVAAQRRRLPMVEVSTEYRFQGPRGSARLLDLFEGRSQLNVRHSMFHPDWDEGCVGCSLQVDNLGHPAHLEARDTTLVLVSRAPLEKLLAFRRRMGGQVAYSSQVTEGSDADINADFDATSDDGTEQSGLSVFLQREGRAFHTCASSSRGGDALINTYNYLDLTPLVRQEEHLPFPQAWWRHHDRYLRSASATEVAEA